MTVEVTEKYQRANGEETNETGDVLVGSRGRVSQYVAYAARLVLEEERTCFTIKATGRALGKAVQVAEVVKRRLPGLYQLTEVGTIMMESDRVPEEAPVEDEKKPHMRAVSYMHIKLSKDPLDKNAIGFQAPLPSDCVEETTAEELMKVRNGVGRRSRGKGARKSPGKGKKEDVAVEIAETKKEDVSPDENEDGTKRKSKEGKGRGKGKGKGRGKGKGKGRRQAPKEGEEAHAEDVKVEAAPQVAVPAAEAKAEL